MRLELPSRCRRGEQVGVRAVLSNNVAQEQLALLVLPASEQYKFVHVEPDGYVQHFRPRLSGGAHQHLVVVSGSGDRWSVSEAVTSLFSR